jgi:serpin B
MKTIALCLGLLLAITAFASDSTAPAATAINSFGLDLLRQAGKPEANALFSPYSIQTALAMTYAGADGVTRDEMTRTSHFGTNEIAVHRSFGLLQWQMDGVMQRSIQMLDRTKKRGSATAGDPITLTMANRLFGQQSFAFRTPFLELLKTNYHVPLMPVDFMRDAVGATRLINDWVDTQTKDRIRNLIPDHALDIETRLVLVNAIYLKAPWETPFYERDTKPLPFHVTAGSTTDVPTMQLETQLGYAKYNGFTAVTIPYKGGEIQFLILLPDATNGLASLESRLTQLDKCANLPNREVDLYLPKFKNEPSMLSLKETLRALGMKTAFESDANFGRMVDPSLFISGIFHKTFLVLDEKGTEAAAATVVAADGQSIPPEPPKPVQVKVDHPFLFAIQHRASGVCLFLGHVADPR